MQPLHEEDTNDGAAEQPQLDLGLDDVRFEMPQQQTGTGLNISEGPAGPVNLVRAPPLAVPAELPGPAPARKRGNAIQDRAIDRTTKTIKILARLARVDGFNDALEIRAKNGSFLSGSNLVLLLWHALAAEREVKGLEDFVALLREARVQPEWINNANVRAKLSGATPAPRRQTTQTPPPQSQTVPPPPLPSPLQGAFPPPAHRATAVARKRHSGGDDDDEPGIAGSRSGKKRRMNDDDGGGGGDDDSDGDMPELEPEMPVLKKMPSHAEMLRQRKRNIAQVRGGDNDDWGDSD